MFWRCAVSKKYFPWFYWFQCIGGNNSDLNRRNFWPWIKSRNISKSDFVRETGHLVVLVGVFSLKEGAKAISEVPAAYMTPLFMPLEGRMVSLNRNWASKGHPKLIHFVEPKHTVYIYIYINLRVTYNSTWDVRSIKKQAKMLKIVTPPYLLMIKANIHLRLWTPKRVSMATSK